MSLNIQESLASSQLKSQTRIKSHEAVMRHQIQKQELFDPDELSAQRWKFVDRSTKEIETIEERLDVHSLLNFYWCNMIEHEENRIYQNWGENVNAHLCIYPTEEWIHVAVYGRKLGNSNVYFQDNAKRQQPGFPARMAKWDGEFEWGYNCRAPPDGKPPLSIDTYCSNRIFDHMIRYCWSSFVTYLMGEIKTFVEGKIKEDISQVMLIIPAECYAEARASIRSFCKEAEFDKVVILTDSSVAAYFLFHTLPAAQRIDNVTVLIVNIDFNYKIRLDIFGCELSNGEINGVKLLTVVLGFVSWIQSVEKSVKTLYKRAISQLPDCRRNSIRYYAVLSAVEKLPEKLDGYLGGEEKLIKMKAFGGKNLLEVFSHFSNKPGKLRKFLDVAATAPNDDLEVVNNIQAPTESKAPLGTAKLPLKICTFDGKTYKILAYTNWTVRRLKKEFLDSRREPDSGPFVFQHRAKIMNDDDSILSSYKMEADSVIQVSFTKDAVTAEAGQSENPKAGNNLIGKCKLIGNCVALQVGTERKKVQGIRKGSLVVARIEGENLTLGEVKLTCKINGFGDSVYVGVKFRQQLAIGSSGIEIEHVGVVQGFCDKCKGQMSLFIPFDQIGNSKEHLFYVQ